VWGASTLKLGTLTAQPGGAIALQSARVAAGSQSLAYMQAA